MTKFAAPLSSHSHYALDGFRALAYLWFLGTRVTQAMTDLDDHYRRSDFYQHPGVVFRLAMVSSRSVRIRALISHLTGFSISLLHRRATTR